MKPLLFSLCLALVGCDADIKASVCHSIASQERFASSFQHAFLVRDNQTGKEYLAVNHCGLIEVEPTKP